MLKAYWTPWKHDATYAQCFILIYLHIEVKWTQLGLRVEFRDWNCHLWKEYFSLWNRFSFQGPWKWDAENFSFSNWFSACDMLGREKFSSTFLGSPADLRITMTWDRFVRGVCNFLGSVSLQQKFEMADQCYSSVLFGKQRKTHPPGVRVGPPKRKERLNFGSSFYVFFFFFFLLPWACPMLVVLARKDVCFTWGSHSGPQTFLCSIFAGFSLLFLLATTILDSFFLF